LPGRVGRHVPVIIALMKRFSVSSASASEETSRKYALADRLRLADVDDPAALVAKQVDARPVGQATTLVAQARLAR